MRRVKKRYTPQQRAKAELEIRRRRKDYSVGTFGEWCKRNTLKWSWDWKHLKLIRKNIRQMEQGLFDHLLILMPVRHGKSEQVTVRYPAYRIEQNPETNIIIGAYDRTLAGTFSRQARNMVADMPYVHISKDVKGAKRWETPEGGGIYATGVGTGVTGKGANVYIIDDPIKSWKESNSVAYRNTVWNWAFGDMYTRREPGCLVIIIMTQWHEDDVAGRILDHPGFSQDFKVLRLPAISETQEERDEYHGRFLGLSVGEKDPIGRKPGEALCPERYDITELRRLEDRLGRKFDALYQQRPRPPEGNMFVKLDFIIEPVLPRGINARFVRYWDKAGTKDGGTWTVGLLMMELKGMYYIVDVVRGQWGAVEREEVIKRVTQEDGMTYAGFDYKVVVEQEPGSGGKESAEATVRSLAGFVVEIDLPTGDKVFRAEPFAVQVAAGNVYVVENKNWNPAYFAEAETFPGSKYKDQIDASSGAFSRLAVAYVEMIAEDDDDFHAGRSIEDRYGY